MTLPTPIQAVLDLLEGDALVWLGPVLVNNLPNFVAAGTDPLKLSLAAIKFQGDIVGSAPAAIGGFEQQLATVLISKVTALQTGGQTQVSSALSTLAG